MPGVRRWNRAPGIRKPSPARGDLVLALNGQLIVAWGRAIAPPQDYDVSINQKPLPGEIRIIPVHGPRWLGVKCPYRAQIIMGMTTWGGGPADGALPQATVMSPRWG